MAAISLPSISGDDVKSIINAIERQRKEMEFLLQNLDSENILSLEAKKIKVGNSTLEVWKDGIDLSVTGLDTDVNGADGLKTRVASAESQISVVAGQVSSKVSTTDYNGYTIASLINQTATNILISAQAIDLVGITKIAGNVYIGDINSSGDKTLIFNGTNEIRSIADTMKIGSIRLDLDCSYINFNPGATVTGLYAKFK